MNLRSGKVDIAASRRLADHLFADGNAPALPPVPSHLAVLLIPSRPRIQG